MKLGYGGTKSEMERLIADANRVKEANGEMADLSIDSFSDVIEAIHIMQEEMDITGTTAEEASKTLEGSFNTMKGAWENWLVAIADPDADLDAATEDLVNSMTIALENAIPEIVTIAGTLFSQIGSQLGDTLSNITDDLIKQLSLALGTKLPLQIQQDLSDAFDSLLQSETFSTLLAILGSVQTAFEKLGGYISDNFLWLFDPLTQAFEDLAEAFAPFTPFIEYLLEGLGAAVSILVGWSIVLISSFVEGIAVFLDAFKAVLDWFAALPENLRIAFDQTIGAFYKWIADITIKGSEAIEGFKNGLDKGWAAVGIWLGGMGDRITTAIGDIWDKMTSIGSNIVDGIKSGMSSAWSNLTTWFSDKINGLVSGAKKLLGIQSPSHVFRDQVGKQIAAGIRVGYEQNDPMKDINRSIGVRVDDIGMSVRSFSSMEHAGAAQQIVNFNQPINRPDDVARTMRDYNRYGLAGSFI